MKSPKVRPVVVALKTCWMLSSINSAAFERITITEFRKAPGRVLRSLKFGGLILYSHNQICGYVLNKRLIDSLTREVSRANAIARDLSELLRAVHPDLIALRARRPDLSLRIDAYLSSIVATSPELVPRDLLRRLI